MIEDGDRESWESAIERQIREAQERGLFDNLPGMGRPLELTPNPYAGDRELAFKVLRDAGYAPDWIEEDKDIRKRLDVARGVLSRRWAWHQERLQELADLSGSWAEAERSRTQAAWHGAVTAFREEVVGLNRAIRDLNLKMPGHHFQRLPIDARREVARIQAEEG
jgi:DnaJ family protein C protein 28